MKSTPEDILKHAGIRVTFARVQVLHVLLEAETALSQPDIERELADSIDRVTIYRVLKSLEDHLLVHRVPDNKGAVKYGLGAGTHKSGHAHFNCTTCGRVLCIDVKPLPDILPDGHNVNVAKTYILLEGTCDQCSEDNNQKKGIDESNQ